MDRQMGAHHFVWCAGMALVPGSTCQDKKDIFHYWHTLHFVWYRDGIRSEILCSVPFF